jgi:hypothetical protein
MIYVDAIRGEDDIARAVEAAGDTPVNINMGSSSASVRPRRCFR